MGTGGKGSDGKVSLKENIPLKKSRPLKAKFPLRRLGQKKEPGKRGLARGEYKDRGLRKRKKEKKF